ncbi:MAG: DegV family protein [Acholeplasmatales bacterium]|nr:MAG: DegV family protein [Acholeplasmatales bacterium]
MEKIGIIIDSTFYLPKAYIQEHDLHVVSLNVIENDNTHKELEIDNDFIYAKQDEKAKLTTSQPSPSEFLEAYEAAFAKGYEKLLILTLSPGLSGTYQSAMLAKSMLEKPDSIHIFDTQNAAYGNELLAMTLIDLLESENSLSAVIKKMEDIIAKSTLMFTVENLYSLQKGGRLSKTQAFIGTMLKVKPIIKIIDGKLQLFHKERTHKKLHEFIVKEVLEDPKRKENAQLHARIITRNSLENGDIIEGMLKDHVPKAKISRTETLGPVFTIHVGPKGFGLCWFWD